MKIGILFPRSLLFVLVVIFFVVFMTTGCIEPGTPEQNVTTVSPPVSTPTTMVATEMVTPTETTTVPVPVNTTEVPVNKTTLPAATSPVPSGTIPSSVTYLTYSNSSYGFSIDYPSDWTVNEAPGGSSSDPASPPGFEPKIDVVEFYSPSVTRCSHGDCVLVQSEMHVEVDPTPSTTVLSDYYIKDVAAISQDLSIDITGHNAVFRLSGQNAYRLDYRIGSDTSAINVQRAYTIIGGKAYVITFHAHAPYAGEVNQFEEYYNSAQEMFRSFKTSSSIKVL